MDRLNNGDWCDDLKGWYYNKNELENLELRGYSIDSKLIVDYTNYDMNKLEIYFMIIDLFYLHHNLINIMDKNIY